MVDFTTVQLIKDVKRRGSVPTNQALFEDQDFVDMMSDCLEIRMIPNILRTREEFFVTTEDFDIAADQRRFALPERATGGRIRQLQILDENDKPIANIQRLQPELGEDSLHQDLHHHAPVFGYFFEGNTIVLSQDIDKLGPKLRVKYFRRPNRLTTVENAGQITAIDTGTGSLTLSNLPAGMITGVRVDIIAGKPHFDSRADSEEVLATGGSSVQVSLETAALVAVGDWVCFEGESVIPQIPKELHQILIQYTLEKVLHALGDIPGSALAAKNLEELERNVYEMLDNRDDGSPQKVSLDDTIFSYDPRFLRYNK